MRLVKVGEGWGNLGWLIKVGDGFGTGWLVKKLFVVEYFGWLSDIAGHDQVLAVVAFLVLMSFPAV